MKNDEYINEGLVTPAKEDINEENIPNPLPESGDETVDVTIPNEQGTADEPATDENLSDGNEQDELPDLHITDDEGLENSISDEDASATETEEGDIPSEDSEENGTDEEAEGEQSQTDKPVTEEADEEASEEENALTSPEEKPAEEAEKNEEKPRRIDNLFDFIELFVFTLAAVFIITSFFFRYSIVDGGSMQNTLQDDERLILRSFLYTPECGDVVVVQDKSTVLKDPIVKRVIAVGGQTVRFTRDAVYVDGEKLNEPYVYTGDYENPFGGEDVYRYSVYPSDALLPIVTDREDGVFYEITVPDGEIFVMGDHRNNSKDSREIGTLHEDAVIGKVVLRFFPFSEFGKIE